MNNIKLYELTEQYRSLEILGASEDLPAEVIRDTLDALEGDVKAKSVNVGLFIRNLESTAEAIEEAAKAMKERADRAKKRAESLKDYLLFNMQACGITKIESEYFTLNVRNNPASVVIDDANQIPHEYLKQALPPPPPPPTIDKKKISDDLKEGVYIPGVHLEQKQRLEIRL